MMVAKNMRSVCLLLLLGVAFAAPAADLVANLPWAPFQPKFPIYSGYLTVTATKSIHYVFVGSQNNIATDPLVLWLNGGPGCSSMDGLFYENGPFVFQEQTNNLLYNNYTWNTNVSMVYFESPAGVGFSTIGDIPSNLNQNDPQTAYDNLVALVYLYNEKFPELKNNPFYIAGESYGGIYVPYLATGIIDYNEVTKPKPPFKINLQGFLVGNGAVNWNVDVGNALPYFAWSHDLIGTNTYNMWVQNNCNANNIVGSACTMAMDEINVQMTNINIYDVYRNCIYNPIGESKKAKKYMAWRERFGLKGEVPCVDDMGLHNYLNNETVRTAFHIPTTFTDTWEICSDTLNYTIDYAVGSYPLYKNTLLASNLRILIYSGDTDAAVPTNGTMTWLNMLSIPNITTWREWGNTEWGQVAGYTIDFQNSPTTAKLSFTTIKGTGHMSIQWKRPQGQYMFQQFIEGKSVQ